jgi:hypothetical protein
MFLVVAPYFFSLPKTLLRSSHILQPRQLPINAPLGHQLGMPADLDHLAGLKNINHIRALHGTQAMRNSNRGAALGGLIQGGLYNLLGRRVQRGRGLVEQQDLGIAQEGSGNRQTLALAAGKQGALCADEGVEAFGEGEDELEDVCVGAGAADGVVGHVVAVGEDVFADGACVERRFLADDGEV